MTAAERLTPRLAQAGPRCRTSRRLTCAQPLATDRPRDFGRAGILRIMAREYTTLEAAGHEIRLSPNVAKQPGESSRVQPSRARKDA
jgi:hypothetical protein